MEPCLHCVLTYSASYYELSSDGCKYERQKSSGLLIYTGTGSTSWYILMYQHVLVCFSMYQYVLACISMSHHVLICLSMYWYVSSYPSMYQHVSVCIGMYQHVSACIGMFQHVSACVRIISMCQSVNVFL